MGARWRRLRRRHAGHTGRLPGVAGNRRAREGRVYVRGINYVYQFNLTTWGWILLILGIGAVATGIGILAQQTWANAVGIVIAFLSALSSFAFMPYYPFWAITVLAFDVFVIWALCSILAND